MPIDMMYQSWMAAVSINGSTIQVGPSIKPIPITVIIIPSSFILEAATLKSKGFIETDALIGFAIIMVLTTLVLGLAYVHQGYESTIRTTIEWIDQQISLNLNSIDTCIITYVPEPSEESEWDMEMEEDSDEGEGESVD